MDRAALVPGENSKMMTKPKSKSKAKNKDVNRRVLPVSSSSESERMSDGESDKDVMRSRSPIHGDRESLKTLRITSDEKLLNPKVVLVKEPGPAGKTSSSQAPATEGIKEESETAVCTVIKRPAPAASLVP